MKANTPYLLPFTPTLVHTTPRVASDLIQSIERRTRFSSYDHVYYIHGWQPKALPFWPFNGIENDARDKLILENNDKKIDFYDYAAMNNLVLKSLIWKEDATDSEVRNVQKKLWIPDSKVIHTLKNSLNKDLLSYKRDKPYRLVGHSLGAQAAILLAYNIRHLPMSKGLKRITLLDPAFLKDDHIYTLDETINMIDYLKRHHDIQFECFQSSEMTNNPFIGHSNIKLHNYMSYVRLKPEFIPFFEQAQRHSHAKNFYFLSFFKQPRTTKGELVQCAQSSLEECAKNDQCFFEQIGGFLSQNPQTMLFSQRVKTLTKDERAQRNSSGTRHIISNSSKI